MIAFGWYGGKYSHLDWLLPLLPPSQHFCDVFGGSAAVIINRHPSPVETYNDIHGEEHSLNPQKDVVEINLTSEIYTKVMCRHDAQCTIL